MKSKNMIMRRSAELMAFLRELGDHLVANDNTSYFSVPVWFKKMDAETVQVMYQEDLPHDLQEFLKESPEHSLRTAIRCRTLIHEADEFIIEGSIFKYSKSESGIIIKRVGSIPPTITFEEAE